MSLSALETDDRLLACLGRHNCTTPGVGVGTGGGGGISKMLKFLR